ncbi:MaoC/PaaZ C-terminal domain-containing protein [Natronobeatus ordinarius]|uniref:MaoC/PaaZ C-terminal domain-containing protein n=1 Tax=Natronobeatus ordinarius TaxID=2963433 RepID=UPI0020CED64E|nr:MaoC/PaaZ C-terminal domain-containing protein [Natronobeatus ordinarius]
MTSPNAGEEYVFERTFTTEDVRRFASLSGDTQPQHVEPDGDGRLMVHGLLTATLPTKIGGDLEVLAHTMTFTFHRPVYTGEPITCTWTHEEVEERDDRYVVSVAIDCRSDDGETVMSGSLSGIVWKGA